MVGADVVELLVADVDVVGWGVVGWGVVGCGVVGWGVVDVVVDEEIELVGGNGICIRSLSHDMPLDVALDLQN